jgi:hypothetical protein
MSGVDSIKLEKTLEYHREGIPSRHSSESWNPFVLQVAEEK